MFALSFVLVAGTLFSDETASLESVSLKVLIDEALKNNPQIKTAKYRYESAVKKAALLRGVKDPQLEYEYGNRDLQMPMNEFSLSQEIPFPTKIFLSRDMYRKEAEVFKQEIIRMERKIIKDVKEAYFQLFLVDKKISVTKDVLLLLSQFVETTTRKYSVGKAKQVDVLRAQVEYSKYSNQLVSLEQEKLIANANIIYVLGRKDDTEIAVAAETVDMTIEINEEEILKQARENRAELKAMKEMLKKAEIEHEMKKQEYFPDIMAKYKRDFSGTGDWSVMLGLNLPVWFWDKQNPSVEETKLNIESVKYDYSAMENMVVLEVKSAYAKYKAVKKLTQIYKTGVLPQAQASLETARLGYEADKIDFLELLDIVRTYREFEIEYYESLANMQIAFAELEYSVGKSLE